MTLNINLTGENMKTKIITKSQRAVPLYYITVLFIVFFAGFMLLRFPETASQGISDGVDLSLGTLIPSLYPFMVLSTLIIELGVFDKLPHIFSRISKAIFSLDSKSLGVIILSHIGGLPLGCKMTSELYERGQISLSDGRKMLMFCYCTGPAFTISSVGLYMLGSKDAGLIIYISLVLASLTVGILSKFFGDSNSVTVSKNKEQETRVFSSSLVRSVSSGSTAMLNVCAWVILFSCINRLIEILPISDSFKMFFYTVSEVTNGAYLSAGVLPLPIIAGIIGFGGLCGHCQVMPYIIKLRLNYKFFLISRIVCASLSVVYCDLLLKLYPVSYQVFSVGTLPLKSDMGISAVYSISMLTTAGLFLLGDSAIFRIKARKDHR